MSEQNTTATTATTADRGSRRVLQGTVTSDKMDKTITVEVNRRVKHPLYEKFINRRTRVHAHDENNDARVGDIVQVTETRPLSKLKRFRLTKVVTRAVTD
jgi:small subunit ribosomal protein S17